MTAFQWEREVQEDLVRIEAIMDEVLHTNVSLLKDMARYIVDSGGKRLRPGVNMTVYRAFGGIDHHVQSRLAAAFEILHTGTLVHDDINDCSTLRRGREAVHVKYGLQNAIVCGDFMFAKSFLIAARHSHEVIERLLETCIGLAEGEILQRKWIDGESLTVNDRMD
ncbi:MAG TPA: hypothetical protein ENN76_03735, partial [Euryarchaeota archaeon]|nr:hypothetical protein [Euryarchaeota archaeon]